MQSKGMLQKRQCKDVSNASKPALWIASVGVLGPVSRPKQREGARCQLRTTRPVSAVVHERRMMNSRLFLDTAPREVTFSPAWYTEIVWPNCVCNAVVVDG